MSKLHSGYWYGVASITAVAMVTSSFTCFTISSQISIRGIFSRLFWVNQPKVVHPSWCLGTESSHLGSQLIKTESNHLRWDFDGWALTEPRLYGFGFQPELNISDLRFAYNRTGWRFIFHSWATWRTALTEGAGSWLVLDTSRNYNETICFLFCCCYLSVYLFILVFLPVIRFVSCCLMRVSKISHETVKGSELKLSECFHLMNICICYR